MPLIDLHTHTKPLSHDSLLTPDDLIDAAKASGLDGVCLTEHDFFWDNAATDELVKRHNFTVIAGNEVNTEFGHILVFGLQKFVFGMHRLADLVRLVGEAGGAMIGAHPYRRQLPFELRDAGDWSAALEQTLRNESYVHVSAIETVNGRGTDRQNEFSLAVCERLGLPATAGSDSHEPMDVGRCATEFSAAIGGLGDLIAELRAGRCRPVVLREAPPSKFRRVLD
ncbi:MAG: PHP domain-containing protein [Chloroflexota bacterium]